MLIRGTARLAISALLLVQTAGPNAWAVDSSAIPTRPSASPILAPKPPEDTFQCERFFVHQDKKLRCDSMIRFDGEGLRSIMQDVPGAIAELDEYQQNRFKVRKSAYIGTAGLALMVIGTLVSLRFKDSTGNSTSTSETIYTASLITGAGMAVGGFLYAISSIKTNEAHLNTAVERYNRARPDSPILLQFSTAIQF